MRMWWFWRLWPHEHRYVPSNITVTTMDYGAALDLDTGEVLHSVDDVREIPQPDHCVRCWRREGA